jgi:hypothetical protein
MEIDEQVSRMLDLVIERKLKLNRLWQEKCLDNEEDEDNRKCESNSIEQSYKLDVECCYIE